MRRVLRANLRWVLAILALVAGAIGSLGYVLSQQNLTFPWEDTYRVKAEFSGTAGLEAGLGQPVNVAGVRVGTVRDVALRDGRALVDLEIDRDDLPAVFRDARAVLVPTTALKDLRIDVVPGTRASGELPDGGVIPVARTTPPIDADDLLSALDADTRELFAVLLAESGRATAGRGADLRAFLKATGPTARQLRSVTSRLARRRAALRRLVSNLATIGTAVGQEDRSLVQAVSGANATVGALAAEQDALDRSLRDLPGTLTALRGTLDGLPAFSREAVGALGALRPTVGKLPQALDAVAPVARDAPGILRTQVRPLVRGAQPVAADLRALTPRLSRVTPYLSSAFKVLTYTTNALGHNPAGDDEGNLYWLAWSFHNIASTASSGDAHGGVIRMLPFFDCGSVLDDPALTPLLSTVLGGVLPSCPGGTG